MIRRRKIKEQKLDDLLMRSGLYTVESLIDKKTRYAVSQDEFCIMRSGDALTCEIGEMPKLASMFKTNIKNEILALYEDLQYLITADIKFYDIPKYDVERAVKQC